MKFISLTPACGRDYTSSKAAIADLVAGKDFILNDVSSQWNGKSCSIHDFPPPCIFRIRYKQMYRVCTYTHQEISQ